MPDGAFNLEVHDKSKARGTLIDHFEELTGAEAAARMEQYADCALLMRERGNPTREDHEALRSFQLRTGKRLTRW